MVLRQDYVYSVSSAYVNGGNFLRTLSYIKRASCDRESLLIIDFY